MASSPKHALEAPGRALRPHLPARFHELYWRVFGVNAAILVVAVLLLGLTPVEIHRRTTNGQFAILFAGLGVMLAANALLLRVSLAPLRDLIRSMRQVDLIQPGRRLETAGSREVAEVISVFNATLARLEDERRSSLHRVLTAQEAERRRVAQELHDQLGQDLTAVLLDIERLRETATRADAEVLDDMAAAANDILEELGRISYELRPAALDDLGLASAVEALCAATARRAAIDVDHRLTIRPPALDRAIELVIFRIIQEGVTNAVRHSDCTRITVRLVIAESRVRLEVADDGRGIGGAAPGGGIRGMRERAGMIGGMLTVESREPNGTQLILRVPRT
jgi:two-component system, NarL family, sensor histidine kinase UhpB